MEKRKRRDEGNRDGEDTENENNQDRILRLRGGRWIYYTNRATTEHHDNMISKDSLTPKHTHLGMDIIIYMYESR